MPKQQDSPLQFKKGLHFKIMTGPTSIQIIHRLYLKIQQHVIKFEQADQSLYMSRNQLKEQIKNYKKKLENAERKRRELTATYYLLAYNFLSDFSSEQTQESFDNLQKKINVFIYASFARNLDFCLESPSFQELFKRTENLELNIWYQERIAHAALLMQDFLKEGYGCEVEYDQIPETANELYDIIINSTAHRMGTFDLDKYMNRIIGTDEERIGDFNAFTGNIQVRREFYKFAFTFSQYICGQMQNFAHGLSLFGLADQFHLEGKRFRIIKTQSVLKDKMEHTLSVLHQFIPKKEKQDPFWKDLARRGLEAMEQLREDARPLFEIEMEWIKHFYKSDNQAFYESNVFVLCKFLKFHTKFLKQELKLLVLERNLEHFNFMDPEIDIVDSTTMAFQLEDLQEKNKQLAADIKFMQKSPDKLFQRFTQREGENFDNDSSVYHSQPDHEGEFGGFPGGFDLDELFDIDAE